MKYKIKAIVSDFDGVLCSDYFYHTLANKDPEIYEFINANLFKENKWMVKDWMRGKITAVDINMYLSQKTNRSYEFFKDTLEESVRAMSLNQGLLKFLSVIKSKGVKTGLLTDNMDVFESITVPEKHLLTIFDQIVPSFKYGMLKGDEEGKLLDVTRDLLGVNYEEILVLDDWETLGGFVKNRNSHFYLYNKQTKDQFEDYFKDNYIF